ncbi:MAG: c-type cytochrome [Planctomycetota bacterium]
MAAQLSRLTLAPKAPNHPASLPVLVALAVSLSAATLWVALLFLGIHLSVWSTPDPQRAESARLAALAPGEDLDVELVARGERLFARSCAQCHASDGTGVAGRGGDLVHPSSAQPTSLPALTDFLTATHPAGSAQPKLPATDAASIAAFVRSLEKPDRVSHDRLVLARLNLQDAEREAARAAKRAEKAAAKELAKSAPAAAAADVVAPDEELDPDMIADGAKLFVAACSTCHGTDAKGLPNNGKPLTTSQFIARLSDENLVAFIKRGRDPGDPANTSKIAMPPKGGNPAISDDDLDCIVTFLRSLQRAAKAGH